jgi:hypothetical protein
MSWEHAMRGRPKVAPVQWSNVGHYGATAAIVALGSLAAYSAGLNKPRPVRVETIVEQPQIVVRAPPPYCTPIAEAFGPATNDAAALRMLTSNTLPKSEKERIAANAAWAKLEAARLQARVDWATEQLKSRDKALDRSYKGSGGHKDGKRSDSRGPSLGKRDVRRAVEHAAPQEDHGGAAFIDRFGD